MEKTGTRRRRWWPGAGRWPLDDTSRFCNSEDAGRTDTALHSWSADVDTPPAYRHSTIRRTAATCGHKSATSIPL